MQARVVREANSNDNNSNNDNEKELINLSKNELVDACETYGLRHSGNKTDLTERITLHLELLSNDASEEKDLKLNEDV